ncbi:tyrosine-type recombinase/integrase [Plebeiibacterium sediminum]|uniref:Site-specific integrase n=1 Tax=Plebeiibacterium sediminum TaxID=2992112 RepID=A0AAE3SHE9_9BACT|nr:site-specific integrase [Plebeiobacterium sediminum]MCW3789478.1 site-specific integrase [Plebeiobacterium sediminum]
MAIIPAIYLDTRTANKDGKYPVKLRLTDKTKRKYYSIRKELTNPSLNFLSPLEFEIVTMGLDSKEKIKEAGLTLPQGFKISDIKNLIDDYREVRTKANTIIKELPVFTFSKFEDAFTGKTTTYNFLHKAFEAEIKKLKDDNRLGYASSLNGTLTNIKYFAENKIYSRKQPKEHIGFNKYKNIMIADIDEKWLKKFRKYLQDKKKSSTSTIGIQERNIRMIFNKALKEGVKAESPFEGKFKPKTATNKKRPLTIGQIQSIRDYQTREGTQEELYKNLFLFSLYGNGANISDILRFKHGNIKNNSIEFTRYKTKDETPEEINITITLTEPLQEIIRKHGTLTLNKDAHLFPFLNNNMDEKQAYAKIKSITKLINKLLKKIAKDCDFDEDLQQNISSYYARHSFATLLKNNKVSIAEISEYLGHTDIKTTQKYLSSIDDKQREKTANKLVSIINGVG